MAMDVGSTSDRQARLERAIGAYLEAADAGLAPDPAQWLATGPVVEEELARLGG